MFMSQVVRTLQNLPNMIKKQEAVPANRGWNKGMYAGTTKVSFKDAVVGQNYVLQIIHPEGENVWTAIELLEKKNGTHLHLKTAEIKYKNLSNLEVGTFTVGKLGYAYLLKY